MKILITGVAGFIGYKFAELMLKKNYKVVGIDNLNSYYSVKLKKNRLKEIQKYKNFSFFKINLEDKNKVERVFKTNKFKYIFHFAAQAGVRFAIISPRDYLNSNLIGFFNVLEFARKFKVDRLFISSSSSVYGNIKRHPSMENFNLNPNNIYSLSKKFNEDLSNSFSKFYNLKITALRFFTVYGEWGRPDMFLMKFISANRKKKIFYLNNKGNHFRDFTYINDVTNILYKLFKVKNSKKFEVYNICGSKPIKISKLVLKLNKLIGKTKIKIIKKNNADVDKTHGSNIKLLKKIGKIKFTSIDNGIKNLTEWFDNYYK